MKPITVINHLTVKPGMADQFLERQRRYVSSLTTQPQGLLSARAYRSMDGKSVVFVREFESKAAHEQAQRSEGLREFLKDAQQYLLESRKADYEEVSISPQ